MSAFMEASVICVNLSREVLCHARVIGAASNKLRYLKNARSRRHSMAIAKIKAAAFEQREKAAGMTTDREAS